MITLCVTIILLLILTVTITVNIKPYGEEKRKSAFEADLKNLKEAIDQYYARYDELPVLKDNNGNAVEYDGGSQKFNEILEDKDFDYLNVNDRVSGTNENSILAPYYVIDKDRLNVDLNYKDKTFIINSQSHTVYLPEGVAYGSDANSNSNEEVVHYRISEVYTEVVGNQVDRNEPEIIRVGEVTVGGERNRLNFTNITSKSFDITAKAQDVGTGIHKIVFHYRKDGEDTYETIEHVFSKDMNDTPADEVTEVQTTEETTKTLETGKYWVYVDVYDMVGNKTSFENDPEYVDLAQVDQIGSASASPTTWTNQNVTVTLPTASNQFATATGSNAYKKNFITQYQISGQTEWNTYSSPIVIDKTTTVKYRYSDGINVGSEGTPVVIENIDKEPPRVYLVNPTTGATISNAIYGENISVKLQDVLDTSSYYGISGVEKWQINQSSTAPTSAGQWQNLPSKNNLTEQQTERSKNSGAPVIAIVEEGVTSSYLDVGTYYVWGKDVAGNVNAKDGAGNINADIQGANVLLAQIEITPKTLSSYEVTLDQSVYTYDGTPKTPTPTVVAGGIPLIAGKDYTVTYTNNIQVGTQAEQPTIRITLQGNYRGPDYETNFTIENASMTGEYKITGTNVVGDTLTATKVSLTPADANVTYQWYRSDNAGTTGGTAINGATSATYTLTDNEAGKHIYVIATASKVNYETTTFGDETDATENVYATTLKITVTLNPNGGSVAPTSLGVTYNSAYGALPTPTKTGYTFTRWITEENLISTDVNDWESGGILDASGENIGHIDRIRLKKHLKVQPNTTYKISVENSRNIVLRFIWFYNENYEFISNNGRYGVSNIEFTTPNNCAYIRTVIMYEDQISEINANAIQDANLKLQAIVNNNTMVTIPSNHTLKAEWSVNTYTVTANANGGTIPETTDWTLESGSETATKQVIFDGTYGTLPTPTKAGYTFDGWVGKNLLDLDVPESEPSSTALSNSTKRIFEPNTYVVGIAHENSYDSGNVLSYNFTNSSINLTSKYGYGIGFPLLDNGNNTYTLSYDVSEEHGVVSVLFYSQDGTYVSRILLSNLTGRRNITFTTPANTYYLVVNFDCNGSGINVDFDNIQLEKSSKETPYEPHYITASTRVTRDGNHTICAHWSANNYTVTANAQGGTIPATTGWTIANGSETATKTVTFDSPYGTLPTPTKSGYTFEGWHIDETQIQEATPVTIAENHTINAHWLGIITGEFKITGRSISGQTLTATQVSLAPNDAALTYQWYRSNSEGTENGTPILGATNQQYTLTDDDIESHIYVVVTAQKENYNMASFADEIDIAENLSATVSEIIPNASNDNISYTITWNAGKATATLTSTYGAKYYIEISTDGTNYTRTNVQSNLNHGDTIYARLANDVYGSRSIEIRISDNGKPQVDVSVETVTSRSITVRATATDNEGGFTNSKPFKYYIALDENDLTTVASTNTTGDYTFDNLDANTTYFIKVSREDAAGNEDSKTVTAVTNQIPQAETAITRTINWSSDGSASVQLSTSEPYAITYSLDNNTWTNYTTAVTRQNGQSLYIRLTDGRNVGRSYEIVLSDYEGPTVTLTRGTIKTNSITVNVVAQDSVSGMPGTPTYTYYIKPSNSNNYTLSAQDITQTSYTFTGLTAGATYNIKVTTEDKIGNEGTGTIDASTPEFNLVNGNITFTNETWSAGKAQVTIGNNTENNLQYQVINNETNISDGAWQLSNQAQTTVSNLNNGDIIVARLFDGVNWTRYATYNVSDLTAPQISAVTKSTDNWTSGNVTITITATDGQTGLAQAPYSFDGGATWQATNTKQYTENTAGIVIKVKDIAGNIANHSQTLNITNIDKTGPEIHAETDVTSSTITAEITNITDGTGSGVNTSAGYTFYIATSMQGLEGATGATVNTLTHTFTGLTANTTYYIKIVASDNLGNTGAVTITAVPGALNVSSNSITISNPVWSNKQASVTINNIATEYDIEYQIVRAGNTFDAQGAWTRTTENTVTVSTLLSGDIVYARLTDSGDNKSGTIQKEVLDNTAPTVSVTGIPVAWTNQDVTLQITSTETESGLQTQAYSFDGGTTWQAANTKTYSANTSGIVIKVRDEAGNIGQYSNTIDITYIDKSGPNVQVTINNKTTKSIQVTASAGDTGAGLQNNPTYSYYIKASTDANYTKVADTTATSYTFQNLIANVEYTVKVEVEDTLGNLGSNTQTITTDNLVYEVGNIEMLGIVWSNGVATINVRNNRTDFPMEYQIATNGAALNQNGTWTKITTQTTEIGNLSNGNIIYARLTDDVNSTSSYATFNINHGLAQSYTPSTLASQTTRGEFKICGISTSNNELRVQIEGEQQNATLYNYYYKSINDENYTLISTNTYYYDQAVITGVVPGMTYKIKAMIKDTNGRVIRSENTATMIAGSQAQINQSYADNKTYIDNSKTITTSLTAGTGAIIPNNTEQISAGFTVSLPATFTIVNNVSQNSGIVLQDANQNEYVWIPVDDAIYDGVTEMPTSSSNASITYQPMANKWTQDNAYYEAIIYYFNGVNSWKDSSNTGIGGSAYKEPSLVTNNAGDGYTWRVTTPIGKLYDADEANYATTAGFESTEEMGIYLANSYNAMITSVDAYGGFLVGRYEATGTGNNLTTKANTNVYTGVSWYTMLKQLDSVRYAQNPYYSTVSVKSSMIWGSQWEAVLNFLLKSDRDNNYISTQKLGTSRLELYPSGTDEDDLISNIYDLGSNAYEWTVQANSYNYRVARGGGYNVIYADKMSTKKNFTPTESGPALGTRIALYIQSTSDTTNPSLRILSNSATSNSITVNCEAIDVETGIKKYDYYISENGTNWELVKSGISNKHKFTQLKEHTTYYIKVQATDGAGNNSDNALVEITTETLGNVAASNIEVIQRLGTNDNGTIALGASSTYTDLGYHIEYQIANSVEDLTLNGWINSDTVNGIQTGETIYATLFDGINRSADYFVYEVEDLEQFRYIDAEGNTYTDAEAALPANANKTSKDKTIKYTDEDGAEAYIPAGFKVGATELVNNINNGLVIQDGDGNQFVWVPVPDVIYEAGHTLPVNLTQAKNDSVLYRPMAIAQTNYPNNYEGIIYNFQNNSGKNYSFRNTSSTGIGKSNYREPSLVTGSADYTWNLTKENIIGIAYDISDAYYKRMGFVAAANVNAFKDYTEFGHYMNNEYTNMIQSVDTYKGFYVGRFETSTETQLTTTNRAQDVNTVVESKRNKTPISNQMWYKQYYYQDSNLNSRNPYYGSNSVTCSMIWGSQWDAIMNWFLKDENTASFVTAKVGNHENRVANTGEFVDDFAKNIFDMSSNMIERTQEAYSSAYRTQRGSAALTSADYHYYDTSHRLASYGNPTYSYTISNLNGGASGDNKSAYYSGTRMSLYIKNEEDSTKPEIDDVQLDAQTNNIKVTVTAKDEESGIGKFKYTLLNGSGTTLEEVETYRATNTFYGLSQGENYTVKVKVTNINGLESDETTENTSTVTLNLTSADITLEKTWGKNGDGRAYFKLADEYENAGYYLQHVVLQDTSDYSESIWTTANIIDKNKVRGVNNTQADKTTLTGLSIGDIVFTRIYDGNNSQSAGIQTMVVQITNLEEYKYVDENGNLYSEAEATGRNDTSKTKNIVYEDTNGAIATIPAGFKVGATSLVNTIANGLVIEDSDENQFVWIPVKDPIYDTRVGGTISSNNNFTPMAVLQSADSQYYEGISYSYNTTTKVATRTNVNSYGLGKGNYREPSLVTGTANYTWSYDSGNLYDGQPSNYNNILNAIGITNATELGLYMNDEFTTMVQSVDRYKGFYVGRYETTAKDDANKTNTNATFTNVARTKFGYTPMCGTSNMNWYRMYLLQDSNYSYNPYYGNSNVKTSMIWGAQWDQMMNYILKGSDQNVIVTLTGNHTGSKKISGQFGSDIANNIFDLSANLCDWTQEAHVTYGRLYRGAAFGTTSTSYAVSRNTPNPLNTSNSYGSRMTMYIKIPN